MFNNGRCSSVSSKCFHDLVQVLLWHYPDTSRVPVALETEHRANLFGVAILPFSNNCKIVSGAMDYTVQLHELGEGAAGFNPSCGLVAGFGMFSII
jgi:WD and tetratricopeptide repeat-containing protein 1